MPAYGAFGFACALVIGLEDWHGAFAASEIKIIGTKADHQAGLLTIWCQIN